MKVLCKKTVEIDIDCLLSGFIFLKSKKDIIKFIRREVQRIIFDAPWDHTIYKELRHLLVIDEYCRING